MFIWQTAKWWIIFGVVSCSGLLVAMVAPPPYNLYGGDVFIVCASSYVVYRSLSEVLTETIARHALPYAVATFFVVAPVILFATGEVQKVATIIWIVLVGVAGFYWIVSEFIHSFQKRG